MIGKKIEFKWSKSNLWICSIVGIEKEISKKKKNFE